MPLKGAKLIRFYFTDMFLCVIWPFYGLYFWKDLLKIAGYYWPWMHHEKADDMNRLWCLTMMMMGSIFSIFFISIIMNVFNHIYRDFPHSLCFVLLCFPTMCLFYHVENHQRGNFTDGILLSVAKCWPAWVTGSHAAVLGELPIHACPRCYITSLW